MSEYPAIFFDLLDESEAVRLRARCRYFGPGSDAGGSEFAQSIALDFPIADAADLIRRMDLLREDLRTRIDES